MNTRSTRPRCNSTMRPTNASGESRTSSGCCRAFPLSPDAPLVIGRGRQTVTRLSDPRVSRVHCQVELRGSDIFIKDLNSVGGTLVNDRAVTEQLLRPGDVIQIGETKLRLECAEVADQMTLPPDLPGDHIPMALPVDAPPHREKSRDTGIRPAEPPTDPPPAEA